VGIEYQFSLAFKQTNKQKSLKSFW